MEREVIGLFNNAAEAERVRDEVIAAGIDKDNVKLFAGTQANAQELNEPGFWQKIKEFFGGAEEEERRLFAEAARRGATAVAVDADNDIEESRAADIMQRHNPINLEQQAQQWGVYPASSAQATQQTQTTQPAQPTQMQSGQEQVLPIVEEQLQVGKREVQRGAVRVYSRTTQKPVQENVQLREEHVTVERRPADRPATGAEKPFEQRTIEVTESAEEAVVGKKSRVVEEVVVKKDVQEKTQTIHDTVRRTDIEVEKLGPEHGERFIDNYAQELSLNEQYRGRDWNMIESDVRTSFEQRYPGSKWDQFKDSIHRGYDRLRKKT